ncbi:SGNH/GDSL hydrolase family protein [Massilia horti]|uniref:Esterase n=1 Tax=Massilia horti TaxID=2562153 RepID=A0A4Y9T183_9BURK|nr:SGNH/GDSL hydrolase family protein [Massilia horti]TFW33230.1 esterase [Massilia horti]
MRKTNFALALLTAAALAACGGNGSTGGDQSLKTKFSSQVSFGDSLSDVGTYAVGPIAAMGGGKYTINGNNTSTSPDLTGKNWTELVAAQLGLPAPCAAQTGLQGDAKQGFSVAVVNNNNCLNYAQGGSRVTNPVGPGNALTGSPLGQMTVPVAKQIDNHLAKVGGKFTGTEFVTVMVGGNDILMQLGGLQTDATAAGSTAFATSLTGQLAAGAPSPASAAQAIGLAIQTEAARPGSTSESIVGVAVTAAVKAGNTAAGNPAVYGPMVAKAQTDATTAGNNYFAANSARIVSAMATAGAETVALVKNQIIGKGANFVLVNNLPDVASTPSGKHQTADVQKLIDTAVNAYNDQLKSGLAGESKVLLVDFYTVSKDQVANPAVYGLSNTKEMACSTDLAKNALGGTSLVCNAKNVVAGDVSRYMFADEIHPTPFEYRLVASYVLEQMVVKGWL